MSKDAIIRSEDVKKSLSAFLFSAHFKKFQILSQEADERQLKTNASPTATPNFERKWE